MDARLVVMGPSLDPIARMQEVPRRSFCQRTEVARQLAAFSQTRWRFSPSTTRLQDLDDAVRC